MNYAPRALLSAAACQKNIKDVCKTTAEVMLIDVISNLEKINRVFDSQCEFTQLLLET